MSTVFFWGKPIEANTKQIQQVLDGLSPRCAGNPSLKGKPVDMAPGILTWGLTPAQVSYEEP